MPLSTSIQLQVKATYTGANKLGATPSFPLDYIKLDNLASGVAASQADKLFSDSRTLSASATENLDLAGGLTDQFGATLTFVKVKALIIRASSGNTNNVNVKPEATNGFLGPFNALTSQLSIPPGGQVVLMAPVSGWAVTASTGDLITVANSGSGTSVTYDIIVVGTSA